MGMSSKLCCLPLLVTFFGASWSANLDAIGFPQNIEDETLKNANNRSPLDTPICPVGELLYPGDNKGDWICDCRPAFLYSPKTDKCHEVYKQGPCSEGEYMVLGPNGFSPACKQNPCKKDCYVMFNKTCQRLNTPGACALNRKQMVLGVNATTLAIECLEAELETRFGDDDDEEFSTVEDCPPWSRRDIKGLCKKIEPVKS